MTEQSQQQFDAETAQEEYDADQQALPVHKQDGFAERMMDEADMLRKQKRENGK